MQRFFVSGLFGLGSPRGRRPRPPGSCLLLFLLILFWSGAATASSQIERDVTVRVTGIVIDSATGEPIANAAVSVSGFGRTAVTGPDGRFSLTGLPPGAVVLSVRHVSYEMCNGHGIQITPDQPAAVVIRLRSTVYDLPGMVVSGQPSQSPAVSSVVLDRAALEQTRAATLPDALEGIEGVWVQRAGPSGETRIRIRGSGANQVLVLVDGQRLNASSTGFVDIGSVPLEVIERVEIYRTGASARFGPDALGGAINIVTGRSQTNEGASVEAAMLGGSYGQGEYRLTVTDLLLLAGLTGQVSYRRSVDDGDFPYSYSASGPTGKIREYNGVRSNNAARWESLFAGGHWRLSGKVNLRYSLQLYDARRGLPGAVSDISPTAISRDKRTLIATTFTWQHDRRGSLETLLAFSEYAEQFIDTLVPQDANKFHGEFLNDVVTVRQHYDRPLWVGSEVRMTGEYRRDVLFHDDWFRRTLSMGRSARNHYGTGLTWNQRVNLDNGPLLDHLSLRGALRYDRAVTDKDSTSIFDQGHAHTTESLSPSIGVSLSGGGPLSAVLRVNYGKSLRLPELNALFWKGDARSRGNPNLRPERSEHSEAALEIQGQWGWFEVAVTSAYFHARTTDLVQWQVNFQGAWQPVNVGSALITGHEETVEIAAFNRAVVLSYQNAVTNALNKVVGSIAYNNRLSFYPRYLSAYALRFALGPVSADGQMRTAGRTYTNDANTKWYGAYRVLDCGVSLELHPGARWDVTARVGVDNITDEDYVLLANYPMPGRSFTAGMTLTFRIGKTIGKQGRDS